MFNFVAPEEKRKNRRIIKTFNVHPNSVTQDLCPVATFLAFQKHPILRSQSTRSSLLVNTKRVYRPVVSSTVSSWLPRWISLSTSEPKVSVRSVSATLALERGLPLQNIITLGNWSNSTTFENHFRRHQVIAMDFTSLLLFPLQ